MLSHNNMKNKIVFAVAIGFLVALVQSRPLQEDSLSILKDGAVAVDAVLPAVPVDVVKVSEIPVVSVETSAETKDKVVPEVLKDSESTILSVVPIVAIIKADSSDDGKSNDDSSSVESSESKESSEEVKVDAIVKPSSESSTVAEASALQPVLVAAAEPPVAAAESKVVAAIQPAVIAVEEPAVKPLGEPIAAALLADNVESASVQVPELAINTKSIDAEEYVRSADDKVSPSIDESPSKVIIVTPSAEDVTKSEVSVASVDKIEENDASVVAPVSSPVEEVIKPAESVAVVSSAIEDDASKKTEEPAVASPANKADGN